MSLPPLTKDDLIAVWRSVLPKSYTTPIETEANGQGFDPISAAGAIFERAAEAANASFQSYFLLPDSNQTDPPAAGARFAIGKVTLARSGTAAQAIVLTGGVTKMVADVEGPDGVVQDGVVVSLAQDVTFPVGYIGTISVSVIADRVGPQGNLRGGSITRFKLLGRYTVPNPTVGAGNTVTDSGVLDRFSGAVLGRLVKLVGGANNGVIRRATSAGDGFVVLDGAPLVVGAATSALVLEPEDVGISVTQPNPLHDGVHGELDAIGEERASGRLPGETDDAYRERLARLPDVVSPNAILRIAARVLTPLGVTFRLLEVGSDGVGSGSMGLYLDVNFYLDVGTYRDGTFLTSSGTRQFVLVIGWSDVGNPGLYLDRGYLDVAYLDGYSLAFVTAVGVLIQLINAARAAGVRWSLLVDPLL